MAQTPPRSFGILLFPGYALLDLCGPLEILNALSSLVPIEVALIALDSLDPVPSKVPTESIPEPDRSRIASQMPTLNQRICPTHTLDTAPELDVLMMPGGFGVPGAAANEKVLAFIRESKAKHIISICNGATILASTGLLDGKRATTNKWWYEDVIKVHPKVNWVHRARWVSDGRYWTSSGISAGMDLMAAFVTEIYGPKIGQLTTDILEYTPELNPENDPFVDTWKKYVTPGA
ncbi:hypothetical protein Unana1_03618 [Umbelopsis nana]